MNKFDLFGKVLNEVEQSVIKIMEAHQEDLGIDPDTLETPYEGMDDDLCDAEHTIAGTIVDILDRQYSKPRGRLKMTDEGYIFVSKTGIEYSIYEGLTIGESPRHTSDIMFITFDRYCMNQEVVDFLYGATFLTDKDTIKGISQTVDEWELFHPDIVEAIKSDTIEHV